MLQLLKMPYALKRDLPKGHKDLKRVGQKVVQAIEGLVNILIFLFYSNYALPQRTFLSTIPQKSPLSLLLCNDL